MIRIILLQISIVLIGASFAHAQYINVQLYVGTQFENAKVELWKNGGNYGHSLVGSNGYVLFTGVEETLTTFRILPHESTYLQVADNRDYCPTDITLDLSVAYSICDYYVTGIECRIDSGVSPRLASSGESIEFTVVAGTTSVPGVLVSLVAYDANDWIYFPEFTSDTNGVVKIPVCGLYQGSFSLSTYHTNYIDHYNSYTIASPASATLSQINLGSNTNGTSIQLNLIDENGNPWSVPTGHNWASIGCDSVYDPNNTNNSSFIPVYTFLDVGESSTNFEIIASATGENLECYFYSSYFDSNTYTSTEYEASAQIRVTEGQSAQLNLRIIQPIDVTIRLLDDKGNPVTEPVSVQAEPDGSNPASLGGASGYQSMGAGINTATMKLTPGVSYEFTVESTNYGQTSPQSIYYLFSNRASLTQTVGTGAGESTDVTLTLKTTPYVAQIQANGPNGPASYAQIDARCYASGTDGQGNVETYDAYLDGLGQAELPLPENQTCELEADNIFDSNGTLLIPSSRSVVKDIQANTPVTFSFLPPDYTLRLRALKEDGSTFSGWNYYGYCAATSIDGKVSSSILTDPVDPTHVILPMLTEGESPTHWRIYCELLPADLTSDYYQGTIVYATKAGVDIDSIDITLKAKTNQAFEAQYSVKPAGGTFKFNNGEISVPSSAFSNDQIVHAKFSTINQGAKEAKPTGGLIPLLANIDIAWNEKEDGSGKLLQPQKSLLLKMCFDLANFPDGSPAQVQLAHYNKEKGVWELEGGKLTTSQKADGTEFYCLEGNAKNFSVWNAILDIAQKKQEQNGDGGSGEDSEGGSSSITDLRAVELTKTAKGKNTTYQLQCDSEASEAIFGFEIVENKGKNSKKSKKRKKKKGKKKKGKKGKEGDKNANDEVDPFEGAELQTSDKCELNVKVQRGKKYLFRVREGNENPTDSKPFQVKNRQKGKKSSKGKKKHDSKS